MRQKRIRFTSVITAFVFPLFLFLLQPLPVAEAGITIPRCMTVSACESAMQSLEAELKEWETKQEFAYEDAGHYSLYLSNVRKELMKAEFNVSAARVKGEDTTALEKIVSDLKKQIPELQAKRDKAMADADKAGDKMIAIIDAIERLKKKIKALEDQETFSH